MKGKIDRQKERQIDERQDKRTDRWKVRQTDGMKDILTEMAFGLIEVKISMLRHKNEGLSISFLGVFFPTPPLLAPQFMTSLRDFLRLVLDIKLSC